MTRDTAFTACIAILIGLTAFSVGCRRRVVGVSAEQMARYEQNLIRIAARDTGCHAGQLSAHQISSDPPVLTVTGCAEPADYWLRCARRGRSCRWQNVASLNVSAAVPMQCAPEGIQQQFSQSPNVRFALGCGQTQPFTVVCNGEGCGWAPSGPPQATHAVMQQPTAQPVVVAPPAPPPQAPSAALQTQVQQQREAILSCVDAPSLTLRLRWTNDGQVIVQMPQELLGTAAEGCLQALLGGMRVAAEASGEVVVPLQ